MESISIRTHQGNEMIDITPEVSEAVYESGIEKGVVLVFAPHTTAGVTINENADPDVIHDILLSLEELVPRDHKGYRHGEGNSDAHVKSTLVGSSVLVGVEDRKLQLGTWQGIYFCEFDGPRRRKFYVEFCKKEL